MALQTRSKTIPTWRGYGRPCGLMYKQMKSDHVISLETVNSYRGVPKFVDIGGRRVKAYNYFRRYKFSYDQHPTMIWCPAPDRTAWMENQPGNIFYLACLASTQTPVPSAYVGSTWPLCTENQLAEFAAARRDFVIRDMFVKANSPRFDGAVFLAELNETLVGVHKLLLGSVKTLFVSGYRGKTIKNLILNPQDLWLWYRYALMPAILSTCDLLEAIKPQKKITRIQDGNRSKPKSFGGTVYYGGYFKPPYSTLEMPFMCTYKIGLGGALDIGYRNDPFEWGFSAIDLFRASYERIPFSFVFDWIINLGDYLTTLRSLDIAIAQSYATYAIEATTTLYPGNFEMQGPNPVLKSFLMERIVDVHPPKIPLVDKEWRNVIRTIDLISLTIGMLKGILTRRMR